MRSHQLPKSLPSGRVRLRTPDFHARRLGGSSGSCISPDDGVLPDGSVWAQSGDLGGAAARPCFPACAVPCSLPTVNWAWE